MVYDAFRSGLWAAIGSVLGKLSGNAHVVGDSYIIWAICLILMVLANTYGCRHYLLSLGETSNSVIPTVISAATSYILSGIFGVAIFNETASINWWIGALIITIGLTLVVKHQNPLESNKNNGTSTEE